jgi:hypothetical protein
MLYKIPTCFIIMHLKILYSIYSIVMLLRIVFILKLHLYTFYVPLTTVFSLLLLMALSPWVGRPKTARKSRIPVTEP